MSLINQMLKDLDARRSDGAAGGSFGAQIRVVSERRRIHPMWWVATGLGGALVGALAFALLRPQTPVQPIPGAQLPLKMDVGLNTSLTPSAATEAPKVSEPVAEVSTNTALAAPVLSTELVTAAAPKVLTRGASTAISETKVALARTNVSPPTAKKEPPALPVPEMAKSIPMTRTLVPVVETPAPPIFSKQVKELTPAQRTENDYRKAMVALQQGKRAEAIGGLESVLQVEPKHAAARNALVGILLDGKQQDEAMQKARDGLEADPAQTGLAMILARLQLEKGELHPAVETLERSLPHAAGRADYVAFLAALLQREGKHKQAAEYYLLALQKSPQNGLWWVGLGISLQAEQRLPEAQEAFKRAKASNSLSAELLAFVDARLSQLQN